MQATNGLSGVTCVKSPQQCCHCCIAAGNHEGAERNPWKLCETCYNAATIKGAVRVVRENMDKTDWSCGCGDFYGSMSYCERHGPNNFPPTPVLVMVPVQNPICGMHGCNRERKPEYKFCQPCFNASRCNTAGCTRTCGKRTDGSFRKYCGVCFKVSQCCHTTGCQGVCDKRPDGSFRKFCRTCWGKM